MGLGDKVAAFALTDGTIAVVLISLDLFGHGKMRYPTPRAIGFLPTRLKAVHQTSPDAFPNSQPFNVSLFRYSFRQCFDYGDIWQQFGRQIVSLL